MKNILYFLLAGSAISIAFYPFIHIVAGLQFGLLNMKEQELLSNVIWNIGFYTHISWSGIALFVGWPLFSKRLRLWNIQLHKLIGKVYVLTAIGGAISGIYIAFYVSGGLFSAAGFVSLGIIWLFTTSKAYLSIKTGNISIHEKMMVYSYATCFAAVTFRIWLPFFSYVLDDFKVAYGIAAWCCWIPNLVIAYFINERAAKPQLIISNG